MSEVPLVLCVAVLLGVARRAVTAIDSRAASGATSLVSDRLLNLERVLRGGLIIILTERLFKIITLAILTEMRPYKV